MKVKTISSIITPRGEIPAGRVVIIPDEVFERLGENVKHIPPLSRVVCYWCRGNDFWESAHVPSHWVCRICNPPTPGAERKFVDREHP